ncbi:MAG: hypothetical protein GY795_00725 [Desulfobacterales bacterium]|nr:hypothetical protein [Desulfobacterales bacterium]
MRNIKFYSSFYVAFFVLFLAIASTGYASYPTDPTSDTDWDAGYSGVSDIQSAFNNGRIAENSQLGTSVPMLSLPSQAEWGNKTDNEKALWLINKERVDRGLVPLQDVEDNVTGVAQYYAQYLLDNDAWGHYEDGNSPWERLDNNAAIGSCHDSLGVAENLAVFVTSGSSIPLPIERSVYNWMYDDSNSSWGHRHAILWYSYNDNSGSAGSEGFLGIGRANGGPYQGSFSSQWNHAELIVMNVFDPCSTWSSFAEVSSPASGSTLSSTNVTFSWDNSGASQYWLWIGTSSGANDVYSDDQGTNTSVDISGLPRDGEALYVRLWSKVNGEWVYSSDNTYNACNCSSSVAAIQNPASGSALASDTETFTWNNSGASQYWLWIGTSSDGNDVYNEDQGTNTSVAISGLPHSGETLYVRLWSKVNGAWLYNSDYTYTACNHSSSIAGIQSPASGSALASTSETFTWDNAGASQYWLWIGTSAGSNDVYNGNQATNTSAVISDLPSSGETLYVRLWSKVSGTWFYDSDSTYTAVGP